MFLLLDLLGGFVMGTSPYILPVLPALFLGAAGDRTSNEAPRSSEAGKTGVGPLLFRIAPDVNLGGGAPKKAAVKANGSSSVTRRPVLIVLSLVTSFVIIMVVDSALLSPLSLSQALIRWTDIVLLLVVDIDMIILGTTEVLERPFTRLAPHTTGDSAGFDLGLVLGVALIPCTNPVPTLIIVAPSSGQITWHIVGLVISFAIGVSIPLMIVAIAGLDVAARFLRTHQYPPHIAADLAAIALVSGITTGAPMALQRMIPDYATSLEAGTEDACEDGACKSEHEVQTSTGFVQYARNGTKDCGTLPATGAMEWLNSLGEPHGMVILVDSWSSSCVNCAREILEVERTYEKYKGTGLVVIDVHPPRQIHEREASVVSDAASHLNTTYPVALDPGLEAFKVYGADAWLTRYLAEPDRQLCSVDRGTSGLEEQIRILFTEAGVSLPN